MADEVWTKASGVVAVGTQQSPGPAWSPVVDDIVDVVVVAIARRAAAEAGGSPLVR